MTVTVVIPYRANSPERAMALDWVLGRWSQTGYQILIGEPDTDAWCKGAAVWDGVRRALGDILVVADADVWCDGIEDAFGLLDPAGWVMPHARVHRLSAVSTRALLEDRPGVRSYARPPYMGKRGGGLVILRRRDYLRVPIDPRFVGWGQEDDAWGLALSTLLGPPRRGEADLLHLWHPPEPRLAPAIGSEDGWLLYRRYRRAQHRPERMRSIVEEAISWLQSSGSCCDPRASGSSSEVPVCAPTWNGVALP